MAGLSAVKRRAIAGWLAGRPRLLVACLALGAVGVVSMASVSVVALGWWRLGPPARQAALTPTAVTSATATPAPTPSDTPSPTATATPSPTPAPLPARTAPPPPGPAAAPAHPPAAPPPVAPPPPAPATVAVPWQHQVYNLSCEESSLSMVEAFYGHTVTDQDVLTFIRVDLKNYFTGPGGGDPFALFVGDPNGSEVRNTGYGVYWPPIQAAAQHFGAPVTSAGQGIAPASIYAAVKAGGPAIVWVTFDLAVHARNDYVAFDGRPIPYAGPEEHAMVVTGVSDTSVRLNDPDRSQYWISRSQFEAAYAVYGQMAVLFGPPGTPVPTPTHTPTPTAASTTSPAPSPT
jgi:uncharacterized protein YvpB